MKNKDKHVLVVKSSINNPEWSNRPLLYWSGGVTFDLNRAMRFPDKESAEEYLETYEKGKFLRVLMLQFSSNGNPIGLCDSV